IFFPYEKESGKPGIAFSTGLNNNYFFRNNYFFADTAVSVNFIMDNIQLTALNITSGYEWNFDIKERFLVGLSVNPVFAWKPANKFYTGVNYIPELDYRHLFNISGNGFFIFKFKYFFLSAAVSGGPAFYFFRSALDTAGNILPADMMDVSVNPSVMAGLFFLVKKVKLKFRIRGGYNFTRDNGGYYTFYSITTSGLLSFDFRNLFNASTRIAYSYTDYYRRIIERKDHRIGLNLKTGVLIKKIINISFSYRFRTGISTLFTGAVYSHRWRLKFSVRYGILEKINSTSILLLLKEGAEGTGESTGKMVCDGDQCYIP
ncbi:MAG: hypothetical protein KAS39_08095, partial [Actinomycetia bacterium]|nr:hypothetical protein [Actinomycetes bacterium]